jgi:hypothetical protein
MNRGIKRRTLHSPTTGASHTMKAEQRKELETNTLADRMGQMVKRVKGSQRRTMLIYFFLGLLLLFGLFIGYRYWQDLGADTSRRWLLFNDGSMRNLSALAETEAKTPAGKAARLQVAWFYFWDLGVRSTGADKMQSIAALREAEKTYEGLLEDCKAWPSRTNRLPSRTASV